MVGDSNDKTNFPYNLLLTNTHILRLCKTFGNNSSPNSKFKTNVWIWHAFFGLSKANKISNEEMEFLKESGLLIKDVSETIKKKGGEGTIRACQGF